MFLIHLMVLVYGAVAPCSDAAFLDAHHPLSRATTPHCSDVWPSPLGTIEAWRSPTSSSPVCPAKPKIYWSSAVDQGCPKRFYGKTSCLHHEVRIHKSYWDNRNDYQSHNDGQRLKNDCSRHCGGDFHDFKGPLPGGFNDLKLGSSLSNIKVQSPLQGFNRFDNLNNGQNFDKFNARDLAQSINVSSNPLQGGRSRSFNIRDMPQGLNSFSDRSPGRASSNFNVRNAPQDFNSFKGPLPGGGLSNFNDLPPFGLNSLNFRDPSQTNVQLPQGINRFNERNIVQAFKNVNSPDPPQGFNSLNDRSSGSAFNTFNGPDPLQGLNINNRESGVPLTNVNGRDPPQVLNINTRESERPFTNFNGRDPPKGVNNNDFESRRPLTNCNDREPLKRFNNINDREPDRDPLKGSPDATPRDDEADIDSLLRNIPENMLETCKKFSNLSSSKRIEVLKKLIACLQSAKNQD